MPHYGAPVPWDPATYVAFTPSYTSEGLPFKPIYQFRLTTLLNSDEIKPA